MWRYARHGVKSGCQLQNLERRQKPTVAHKEGCLAVGEAAVSSWNIGAADQEDSLLGQTAKGGVGELGARDGVVGGHTVCFCLLLLLST